MESQERRGRKREKQSGQCMKNVLTNSRALSWQCRFEYCWVSYNGSGATQATLNTRASTLACTGFRLNNSTYAGGPRHGMPRNPSRCAHCTAFIRVLVAPGFSLFAKNLTRPGSRTRPTISREMPANRSRCAVGFKTAEFSSQYPGSGRMWSFPGWACNYFMPRVFEILGDEVCHGIRGLRPVTKQALRVPSLHTSQGIHRRQWENEC